MKKITPNTAFLRILLEGRAGSTKTRTAYSATLDERLQPVLAIDAGGQPRSIADYRPEPTILSVESVADLTTIYNWLRKRQPASDPLVKELGLTPPYKTLVIDGFTEIQRLVIAGITGDPMKGAPDVSKERAMYNTILAQTMGIAQAYYALPMHVIGTVLEGERQEGEGGPTFYRPLMVGQSREQLASYAEIVGRMMHVDRVTGPLKKALEEELTANTVSIAVFKSNPRHDAKDQTGRLDDVVVDPTIGKLLDLVLRAESPQATSI